MSIAPSSPTAVNALRSATPNLRQGLPRHLVVAMLALGALAAPTVIDAQACSAPRSSACSRRRQNTRPRL
jgi:hypothetical protein